MVKEQQERLFLIRPIVEEIKGEICDQVCDIARVSLFFTHLNHIRVVILTLAGQDIKIVKTGRVTLEMPLADERRLVTRLTQEFGISLLRSIELNRIVPDPVEMAVFSGENGRPARSADAVCAETAVKANAFPRNPVNAGSFIDPASITAQGMGRMVVGHDKKNVGLCWERLFCLRFYQGGNCKRGHAHAERFHELPSLHGVRYYTTSAFPF